MAVAQVQLSTRVALAKPQILIKTSIQVEAEAVALSADGLDPHDR